MCNLLPELFKCIQHVSIDFSRSVNNLTVIAHDMLQYIKNIHQNTLLLAWNEKNAVYLMESVTDFMPGFLIIIGTKLYTYMYKLIHMLLLIVNV